MKKLILVSALMLSACGKFNGIGTTEKKPDDPKPVMLGTGQRLTMPGTLVLIGPTVVEGRNSASGGEMLSAPLYVADAPPAPAKDRPAITCIAFDEQGRLAGSRGSILPMKFGGGDITILTSREIGKGSVQCHLIKVDPAELQGGE